MVARYVIRGEMVKGYIEEQEGEQIIDDTRCFPIDSLLLPRLIAEGCSFLPRRICMRPISQREWSQLLKELDRTELLDVYRRVFPESPTGFLLWLCLVLVSVVALGTIVYS